ncbi:MAG: adenylosuccinate lyase, partial [Deltaproteobacteria bacterium]|nr:adenylosuccinate lyase [Deltaproteobacteria bacterium]
MITRYSRKEMAGIWTDEAKWETWARIELLACEAWAKEGKIPPAAVQKIKTKARINPKRIEAIEQETRHDVIAFVSALAETVGPEGRFLLMGLTSSDILDSGLACQFLRATKLLVA